jgi:hypothetical protein
MNEYENRQAEKKAYYEEMAVKARSDGNSLYVKAHNMVKIIPFGQPILIGHHSEKSDRAYRGKIDRTLNKAHAESEKSQYYERKAAAVGTGGISSEDPDAIKKLQDKLDKLRKHQEFMKLANKAIRKNDDISLKAIGVSDSDIEKLKTPDFAGRKGFPSYLLTNHNAEIHRLERRITQLKIIRDREPVHEENAMFEYREEDAHCQFLFNGKPSDEIRTILKSYSFKWSPRRKSWVRKITGNAIFAAKEVKAKLAAI